MRQPRFHSLLHRLRSGLQQAPDSCHRNWEPSCIHPIFLSEPGSSALHLRVADSAVYRTSLFIPPPTADEDGQPNQYSSCEKEGRNRKHETQAPARLQELNQREDCDKRGQWGTDERHDLNSRYHTTLCPDVFNASGRLAEHASIRESVGPPRPLAEYRDRAYSLCLCGYPPYCRDIYLIHKINYYSYLIFY